jgi:hypothetical protein
MNEQIEKLYLLSLPIETKIYLLEEAFVENFFVYNKYCKIFLDATSDQGGLSTETIKSIPKRVLTRSFNHIETNQPI